MDVLMRSLFIAALLLTGPAHAGAVLIGNPQTAVGGVDREAARRLLLGETLFWPSGSAVEVLEVRADEPNVEGGYLELTHKTLAQVRAAWNRLVFAGKAEPPVRVGTSAEAKAAVAKRPGAIALVDSSAVDGSVRILFRLP
jgi:hypothetical protein